MLILCSEKIPEIVIHSNHSSRTHFTLQISFIFLFFSMIFFFTGAVLLLLGFSMNYLLLIRDIDDFADLFDRGDRAEGRGLA